MKTSITLHEMGVVVVGQNHNPSILNPDFLQHNKIVPEGLVLAKNVPGFSTPMASEYIFENGFHVASDPNRVAFVEKPYQGDGLCYEAAKTYLQVVPLVHYTAVGINFVGSFPTTDSQSALRHMIKPGGWDQFEKVSPLVEIKLTYPLAGRLANLTIESQKSINHESEQKVFVRGNFHHEIDTQENKTTSYKTAISMVEDWEKDRECFKSLVKHIAKGTRDQ